VAKYIGNVSIDFCMGQKFLLSEFDVNNSLKDPTASLPGKNTPVIDSQLTHRTFAQRAFN
jgi:hypothetical protein